MNEEQAFSVIVKIMYDYNLRDFYKDDLRNFRIKLYQLTRMIEVIYYNDILLTTTIILTILTKFKIYVPSSF